MGLGSILEIKQFLEKYGMMQLSELSHAKAHILHLQDLKQRGAEKVG